MYRKFFKRFCDFIISGICLIILIIPLLVLFILVRIKLGSPVLFVQERLGVEGTIFSLYKLRTMTDEKDENGELLPDEIRLTKFGKMLRASSLDELPEIFNIFKGDMSLVGPRPLLIRYLNRYNSKQFRRMEVRPGLTGLAQVSGRNAISWEKRFNLDVHYVDNYSFAMDVKIFFQTFAKVLNRSDISEDGEATMSEFMGSSEESNDSQARGETDSEV